MLALAALVPSIARRAICTSAACAAAGAVSQASSAFASERRGRPLPGLRAERLRQQPGRPAGRLGQSVGVRRRRGVRAEPARRRADQLQIRRPRARARRAVRPRRFRQRRRRRRVLLHAERRHRTIPRRAARRRRFRRQPRAAREAAHRLWLGLRCSTTDGAPSSSASRRSTPSVRRCTTATNSASRSATWCAEANQKEMYGDLDPRAAPRGASRMRRRPRPRRPTAASARGSTSWCAARRTTACGAGKVFECELRHASVIAARRASPPPSPRSPPPSAPCVALSPRTHCSIASRAPTTPRTPLRGPRAREVLHRKQRMHAGGEIVREHKREEVADVSACVARRLDVAACQGDGHQRTVGGGELGVERVEVQPEQPGALLHQRQLGLVVVLLACLEE